MQCEQYFECTLCGLRDNGLGDLKDDSGNQDRMYGRHGVIRRIIEMRDKMRLSSLGNGVKRGWHMCTNRKQHPTTKTSWSSDGVEVKRGRRRGYYCSHCINHIVRPQAKSGWNDDTYKFTCLSCSGELNTSIPPGSELDMKLKESIKFYESDLNSDKGSDGDMSDGEDSEDSEDSFIVSDDDMSSGDESDMEGGFGLDFSPTMTDMESNIWGMLTGDPKSTINFNAYIKDIAARGYTGSISAHASERILKFMDGARGGTHFLKWCNESECETDICLACGMRRRQSAIMYRIDGTICGTIGRRCATVFTRVRAMSAKIADVQNSMRMWPAAWASVNKVKFIQDYIRPLVNEVEVSVCNTSLR